jgi:hypothetical protein
MYKPHCTIAPGGKDNAAPDDDEIPQFQHHVCAPTHMGVSLEIYLLKAVVEDAIFGGMGTKGIRVVREDGESASSKDEK